MRRSPTEAFPERKSVLEFQRFRHLEIPGRPFLCEAESRDSVSRACARVALFLGRVESAEEHRPRIGP